MCGFHNILLSPSPSPSPSQLVTKCRAFPYLRVLGICRKKKAKQRAAMTEAMIRGQKGMASVKELPTMQDRIRGDFPPVRYARRIPNSGPTGLAVFCVVGFMTSWGLYKVGQFNKYRRLVKAEKLACRQAIIPYIAAEEDRRFVRENRKALEEEARVMANVPGWKVGESVYHSGRWMPPACDFFELKEWY